MFTILSLSLSLSLSTSLNFSCTMVALWYIRNILPIKATWNINELAIASVLSSRFHHLIWTEKVEGKDMHMLKIHEEWIPTSYKNLQWSIKCSVLSNNIFSRYIAVTISKENASRQNYAAFEWLEGKKMKYLFSYSSFTNIGYSTNNGKVHWAYRFTY